jgi:hypothetical protein
MVLRINTYEIKHTIKRGVNIIKTEEIKNYYIKHENMTFQDYAMPIIEEHIEIYFKDLKNEVLENIHTGLYEEEIKDGVPKLCKQLILNIFQTDEDLNN